MEPEIRNVDLQETNKFISDQVDRSGRKKRIILMITGTKMSYLWRTGRRGLERFGHAMKVPVAAMMAAT
jgi:hypothetical protein